MGVVVVYYIYTITLIYFGDNMITGELKNKIDDIWNAFWSGGITNPLTVVEQITYLMFIHDLGAMDDRKLKESKLYGYKYDSIFSGEEEKDIDGKKITFKKSDYKWSNLIQQNAENQYNLMVYGIFPFIKNMYKESDNNYAKYMKDAVFKIDTALKLNSILIKCQEMYNLISNLQSTDKDIKGDVYEYILSKISTSGTNGQFRTPRHIIDMMVELMKPEISDTICDPSCGTAGFLVAAGEYLKKNYEKEIYHNIANRDKFNNNTFTGYDMDSTMLRIAAMNLVAHGIDNPNVLYKDSISKQNTDRDKYTLILANPPFTGSIDTSITSPDLLSLTETKKTELLFIALFIKSLKLGGRCASIVPDGVLFGSSNAHKAVRKELVDNQKLEAVISMPSGVFKPYSGVSTGILIFTKTNHQDTDNVWFYNMESDGYSLDDKREKQEKSDIPDIIARFHNREKDKDNKRTDKSFFVPRQEIVNNGYDLSINKYKEVEYTPVEYPPVQDILKELQEMEKEISSGLSDLERMI